MLLGSACGASTGPTEPPPVPHNDEPSGAPVLATDADLFALLDAVGPIDGDQYDPRPVIAAINALQPLGRETGTALLQRYARARVASLSDRDGLFAVLRVVYEPPEHVFARTTDSCTPAQQAVVESGCLRPPRLGSPSPAPPADLRSLRYPFFVLGDVPLSLVRGYALAGKAEPFGMHLDELAAAATGWLAAPLVPQTAGEIRYLFTHYGAWNTQSDVGVMVEAQLALLPA